MRPYPSPSVLGEMSPWQPASGAAPPTARPALYRRVRPGAPDPDHAAVAAATADLSADGGNPLPTPFRRSMERVFGMDLSPVRVHSGAVARRAADRVGAQALALGTSIALPDGLPDRPTPATLPLVIHELSHVAQHLGGRPTIAPPAPRPFPLARRASAEEGEADRIERMVAGAVHGFGHSPIPPAALPLAHVAPPAHAAAERSSPQPDIARLAAPDTTSRAVAIAPPTPVAAPATPTTAPVPSIAEPEALAERVYALLEQRLLTERERSGAFR